MLVQGTDDTGVYHVGIEVLDGDYVRTALVERGVRLATPMVMGADGRQEFLDRTRRCARRAVRRRVADR